MRRVISRLGYIEWARILITESRTKNHGLSVYASATLAVIVPVELTKWASGKALEKFAPSLVTPPAPKKDDKSQLASSPKV